MPTAIRQHGMELVPLSVSPAELSVKSATKIAKSRVFNIDNGAGTTIDDVIVKATVAITVKNARIVYVTETAGTVAGANVKLGTVLAGGEIVAATAYTNSAAIGTQTNMSLASAAIAAGGALFARHTGIAAVAAGEAYVEVEYTIDE